MKLKVTVEVEHSELGTIKMFGERDIYDDTHKENLVHIVGSSATYIATRLGPAIEKERIQGKFNSEPRLVVPKSFRANAELKN